MRLRLVAVLSMLVVVGCGRFGGGTGGGSGGGTAGGAGGGAGGGGGGGDTGGGGGDVLSTDEMDLYNHGSDSQLAAQNGFNIADSLFQFDPTLDTTRTPAQNATAIQTQALTQLNGCGSATVANTTVTVSFGAAPGCTLVNGIQVSGSASLGVSASGSTTTVAATFTSLVVNTSSLNGSISFATTNGSTFTLNGSLTSGANTTSFTNLTVTGAAGQWTVDGSASATKSGATTALTFTAMKYVQKDCYPSAGTVKGVRGLLSEVITFLPTTPKDGKVTVKVGLLKSSTQSLPAYGNCPPPKDGG